jgi:hypothetical protein
VAAGARWIVQQIVKMAGTAAIDAKAVLVADSDATLVRHAMPDEFIHDGRLWHYRAESAITADMSRHVLWHDVARKLLGVPGVAAAPLHDYISPICVWDPVVVRCLLEHLADATGRNWVDAMASRLHISEFVVYGVFVDHVLGGRVPRDTPLCHNYYGRVPLSRADARAFADRMPHGAIGAMISSHSRTSVDVRREAFARCGEIAERVC